MKFVETRTIIINFMKEDGKTNLLIERFLKLLRFLYKELFRLGKLTDYRIFFTVNLGSIERIVEYNQDIFELDISGEELRLTRNKSIEELVEKHPVDETLISIIRKFIEQEEN